MSYEQALRVSSEQAAAAFRERECENRVGRNEPELRK